MRRPGTISTRNIRTAGVLLLLCLWASFASAQGLMLKRANKLYDQLAFEEAIEFYQAALKKSDDVQGWTRLADCYRLTSRFELAETTYAQVVASGLADPVNELYYAQALMANNRYDEAVRWLESYGEKAPDDERAGSLLEACLQYDSLQQQRFPCEIANLPINSSRSDFAPAFAGESLVFVSDRDSTLGINRSTLWTGTSFLNLYLTQPAPNGKFRKPRKLDGDVNGPYHDGPAVMDSSASVLWFTRSNYEKGALWNRPTKSSENHVKLKIEQARRNGESSSWDIDEDGEFPWNHDEYSTGHPALSENGQWMVFASDRPGGEGGVDLWLSEKSTDGAWGIPVNLGPEINTEGHEMYPFLHQDGSLLFASDGLIGFGGLDLFLATIAPGSRQAWEKPINMGAPVNSSRDDFGMIVNRDWTRAYLSSNRKGGKGKDDIYAVDALPPQLEVTVFDAQTLQRIPGANLRLISDLADSRADEFQTDAGGSVLTEIGRFAPYRLDTWIDGYESSTMRIDPTEGGFAPARRKVDVFLEPEARWSVIGQVIDLETREPLPDATVTVMIDGSGPARLRVDTEGFFQLDLEQDREYSFEAGKESYFGDQELLSTVGVREPEEYYRVLELSPMRDQVVIELSNIYYDLDRAYIRRDAAPDLDRLAQLMRQFPQMAIEISSHTDARADDEYNLELSQRRADAAVDYLLELGIAADRLLARGYGESEIRNRCLDGVSCTEAEHQYNRRTEFRVLNFGNGIRSTDKADIPVNSGNPINPEYLREFLRDQLDSLASDEPLQLPDWEQVPVQASDPDPAASPQEGPATFGQGFVYGIQLGSGSAADAERLAAYRDLGTMQLEIAGNGQYRFVIGYFDNRVEADRVHAKARERGLSGSFVVVYKDGKRLN